jgi:folate-binding protein YgfZ
MLSTPPPLPSSQPRSPPVALPDYGVLTVRGPEARRFLNGQVSQDVLALDPSRVRLAGLHNPQGRLLALMRLVAPADDAPDHTVRCVLPRPSLIETRALLQRYLLRAKAAVQDESDAWRIEGLWGSAPCEMAALGETVPTTGQQTAGTTVWRHAPDGRCLQLSANADPAPAASGTPDPGHVAARAAWHLADIACGLPEVRPANRAAFVAQMLNLDVLGGISFTKGCYTGQEVIARAHYRGRVKRRLQRFEAVPADGAALPVAGDTVQLRDGRAARVVDAALRPDGRLEFLAVAPLRAGETDAEAPGGTVMRLESSALPLPYALPD